MSITDVPSLSGPVAKPLWTPVTARIRNDSPPPPSPLAHRPTPASIAQKTPSCHKQLEIYRVHRGLGAPPLVGLSSVRSAVVSAMEDRGRSAGPICSASPCPGSLFPARRTSRPVHIETAEGIWQAKTRCLRAPPYCPTAASERPREVRKASRSLREPNRTRKRR